MEPGGVIHHLLNGNRAAVDVLAAVFAGVAIFSFLQTLALVVTIFAGVGSLSLVGLRWYDRVKYGPAKGRE